jgi:diaminopimelate decarboxylase
MVGNRRAAGGRPMMAPRERDRKSRAAAPRRHRIGLANGPRRTEHAGVTADADDLDLACRRARAALGAAEGPLALDGVTARQLAEQFGTPLYAYSAQALDARVAAVQQALGPRLELLYSIKANPSLALTAHLRRRGVGAELASLGELHLALAAGHAPAALRFAGPGKTDAELGAALRAGLGCCHAESAGEVAALAGLAHQLGVRAGVAVRVNLPDELAGSRLRMGGHGSRFGVDADQVPALLAAIAADPALRLRGLHVYGGTQCFDGKAFAAHARALVTHAAAWERELGLPLDELDLGGGFGVPVYAGDPEFDLAAAGAGVQELIAAHDRPGRRWFVELGRYLVAPAGIYLARVVRRRTSGGRRFVALDGGMHHCAMAAGVGAVIPRLPLCVHAERPDDHEREAVTIGGPLCTPADRFAADVPLPRLHEGDLVAVLHAGAYGLTWSPVGFLSHPAPAEVLVEDGVARLVRERGTADDVLRGQRG